jgi:protease IV
VKSFFRSFLASLLALSFLLLVGGGLLAAKFGGETDIQDHSWLHLDLYGEVLEYDPPGGVMSEVTGGGGGLTLQKILENLDKAAVDERIDGVLLQMSASHNAGWAKLEEIRGAVARVQEAGKPVYGFADAMDTKTYYLASICDSLYCPQAGYIQFLGFSRTSTHLKGTLEKLGIKPQLSAIRHYKSAAQMLTREGLTPESRKNMNWMFNEFWDMYCGALERDRGLSEERIVELMEHALFTPTQAVEAGLFDDLKYWDEILEMLTPEGEDHLAVVSYSRYSDEDPEDLDLKGDRTIAVVHAQGNIGGRENGVNPVLGLMMGHESIVRELKRAAADEDVAAIVLRVDSGGGESLASDLMGHMVEKISQEKPIIVSMVDVAASGGYSMSYRASKLMADPFTVTGSIGSISGKFDMSGWNEKIGVTKDSISKGPNGMMMSSDQPFSEEEFERFNDDHWTGFWAWMDDVAKFRGIATADIDSLCMGRVWTGRQAVDNKLIDALGGQHEAVLLAKKEAGIAVNEPVSLWHLPEKKDLIESVLGGDEELDQAVSWSIYQRVRSEASFTLDYLSGGNLWIMDPNLRP